MDRGDALTALGPCLREHVSSNSTATDDDDWTFLRRNEARRAPASAPEARIADLFCGCGGLSLGLREACLDAGRRFVAVWAADSDPRALDVYRRNFRPISDLDRPLEEWLSGELGAPPSDLETELKKQIGRLDCLLAGPPCQGHSTLNNKTRHDDERNVLYTRVGRFVELMEPRHVLIENVPAVVRARDQSIHRTMEHLDGLGYWVEGHVVDLSRIGVPQRRKRHIVVASQLAPHLRVPRLARWLAANEVATRSVGWAIGDLEDSTAEDLLNIPPRLSEVNRERIDHLFDHDLLDLPNSKRPDCHSHASHTYKSMYGRLAWDEPAQTITTGFSSPGQGRYVHPSRRRTLTPHEAARLQFFPDDFDFSGIRYRADLARLIGNAVPPKLSWIIGRELLR